jgi:tetratricopeptide (TPR) repeat protein
MFRRKFFPVFASVLMVVSTAVFASAQTGQLRGQVVLKQADGTIVPAADAAIEVFRTDLAGRFPNKTNKKGEFVFAGLPFTGTYVISVSMPGAQPAWLPNVKAGRDIDYKIEMLPGDGKKLTLEEIKGLMARDPGTSSEGAPRESAEDRAKQAELAKKNAEITEKNKKAAESNEIVTRTFKAGNEAVKAKNYDQAIAFFDEGLNADPDHPGAPSLLTNKAASLTSRGVTRYNSSVVNKDEAAKNAGVESAKKDWKAATETAAKAIDILKKTPATDPAVANNVKINLYYALMTRADAMKFFVTKVDQNQVDAGITAYEEYIAVETDAAKKATAQKDMAQMLFDANAFDRALEQYQKMLAANPDDLDALLRSGQALFNIGAINNDKAKYQEAANYLSQFVNKAPDDNAYKGDAKAILEMLKTESNVKPTAAPTTRRRRP